MTTFEQIPSFEVKPPAGKLLDPTARLKIVKDLRAAAQEFRHEKIDGEKEERWFMRLEYKEAQRSPHGVTLGIEIEIPEASVLPPEAKKWKDWEKENFLRGLKTEYKKTEEVGVPAGEDQVWEFAHQHAYSPETLAREVQALIHLELIKTDYKKFPLHVTIGGISFPVGKTYSPYEDESVIGSTHLFARALDAAGWETSADRLIAPYIDDDSNWTLHDCPSGIRNRELKYIAQPEEGSPIKNAVELRTPEVKSLPGLDRYLESAYYLGCALRAFQENKKGDKIGKELAKVWRAFSGKCEDRFEEEGLMNPTKLWKLDKEKPNENSPFKGLSRILDKGLTDKRSDEAKFIHDIRMYIITARAEVKEILEKEQAK